MNAANQFYYHRLYLMSGTERVLASAAGEDAYPTWSPDGSHIIFSSDRAHGGGRNDLYIMTTNGEHVLALTADGANDTYAQWTSRGDVYFVSRRDGHGVYRLRLNQALSCEGRR